MEKKIIPRQVIKTIPAFHTFLVSEHIEVCNQMKISLLEGSGEIYGAQLKKNYPHFFAIPCSIPIYTWEGAEIKIEWTEYENTENSSSSWIDITEKSKQSTQGPMVKYLETHFNCLSLRRLAFEECRAGPKIAVIGDTESAAQNVSKLLLNYSGKYSMNPVFVDLDPESSIFIDGSIGALQFEYKIAEDLFDRPNKICFYYGNRTTKSKTYVQQVSFLGDLVNKKLSRQIKDYKLHGTKDQYPYFASGVIVQCPKYKNSETKAQYFSKIKSILGTFCCTHVVIVGFSELMTFLTQAKVKAQLIEGAVLQGTESFLKLPRPIRSKIQRYFNNQSIQVKYKIDQVKIYELMNQGKQAAHCRTIDIRKEAISKNTVAILHATAVETEGLDKVALYQKALFSPICCLIRIFNIETNEITLEVGQEHFLEQFKDNIWVTSVSDQ